MSFPYISYESSYKKKLEELEKENEELRNRIKQLETNIQELEKALYGRRSEAKEAPFLEKSEADKIAETLGVIASCYPNFSEVAKILSSYKDESLPQTPKECEEYLTNFRTNLCYRLLGRTRRLKNMTDEYLKEKIYPKLKEVFEKNEKKIVVIDNSLDADMACVDILTKNMYGLNPQDHILLSTRTNPISLSFRFFVKDIPQIPYPYSRYENDWREYFLSKHWISLNEDPIRAIFGDEILDESKEFYIISNFFLKPLRKHEAEELYETKLKQLGDVSIPYDDVMVPSSEDYKKYSKKILDLVENKQIEDLEEVVRLGNTTKARKMEYVLPAIALKIRKGKVHRDEKELIKIDEDAYTYESYWTLFHALTNAPKDVYEKLVKYIQS